MNQIKKEDPNPEEQDRKENESDPVIDEEVDKKIKKENEVIETVLDGVFTFFL